MYTEKDHFTKWYILFFVKFWFAWSNCQLFIDVGNWTYKVNKDNKGRAVFLLYHNRNIKLHYDFILHPYFYTIKHWKQNLLFLMLKIFECYLWIVNYNYILNKIGFIPKYKKTPFQLYSYKLLIDFIYFSSLILIIFTKIKIIKIFSNQF